MLPVNSAVRVDALHRFKEARGGAVLEDNRLDVAGGNGEVVAGVDGEVLPVIGAVRVDVLEWVDSREHTLQAQGFLQIACL